MSSPEQTWFIEQVRLEQAGLRAFVRSLGVRAEAVDDIAQEAFVVAFQKLQSFERGTNFGAWLRTIARFLVCKELRREDRRQRLLGEHVAEILTEQEESHPETNAVQAEALSGCLAKLPARSRQLVQRRYFENVSPSVIASQEGRTANEIRQTLFRLRAALHECITRQMATQSV